MIDGEVTSYFEWMGAGVYHVDERSGSMHGKKFLVKEVHFGSDGQSFYLRIDLNPDYEQELGGMEARFTGQTMDGARSSQRHHRLRPRCRHSQSRCSWRRRPDGAVECAFARVLEVRISLAALGIAAGQGLRFQSSRCGRAASPWTPFRTRAGWR